MKQWLLDPIHPCLVHFPIAFLALGSILFFLGLFICRRKFLLMSVVLLVLGAVGAYYAVETGEDAADAFLKAFPDASSTLDIHATWADYTFKLAVAAAVLAFLTWVLNERIHSGFKIMWFITFLVTAVMGYFLYNTGHVGGYMIYHDALKLSPEMEIKMPPLVAPEKAESEEKD